MLWWGSSDTYNTVRLHSAIGYVTPEDMIEGRQASIHAARDRKLEQARQAASTPPTKSGMTARVTMTVPGETEAGSAGKQPCRGITWWAHRDDEPGTCEHHSASLPKPIGSVDPHALKIPARRAEYSLTENAHSPVPAEPARQRPQEVLFLQQLFPVLSGCAILVSRYLPFLCLLT